MAINDVAGEWVYHVWDILREFLGHNFVSLRSSYIKPKKHKNIKKFFNNLGFFNPDLECIL